MSYAQLRPSTVLALCKIQPIASRQTLVRTTHVMQALTAHSELQPHYIFTLDPRTYVPALREAGLAIKKNPDSLYFRPKHLTRDDLAGRTNVHPDPHRPDLREDINRTRPNTDPISADSDPDEEEYANTITFTSNGFCE